MFSFLKSQIDWMTKVCSRSRIRRTTKSVKKLEAMKDGVCPRPKFTEHIYHAVGAGPDLDIKRSRYTEAKSLSYCLQKNILWTFTTRRGHYYVLCEPIKIDIHDTYVCQSHEFRSLWLPPYIYKADPICNTMAFPQILTSLLEGKGQEAHGDVLKTRQDGHCLILARVSVWLGI